MVRIANRKLAVGPLLMLDGATSSGNGVKYDFVYPVKNLQAQMVTDSTDAVVKINASVASSSGAPASTIIQLGPSSAGSVLGYSTDQPVSSVLAVLDAGASSGGVSVWLSGSP